MRKPGDDEEDVDAHESTAHARNVGVIQHDQEDGQRTETLYVRPELACPGLFRDGRRSDMQGAISVDDPCVGSSGVRRSLQSPRSASVPDPLQSRISSASVRTPGGSTRGSAYGRADGPVASVGAARRGRGTLDLNVDEPNGGEEPLSARRVNTRR